MAMKKMYTYVVEGAAYDTAELYHVDRDDTATGILGIQDPADTGYELTPPTPPTPPTSAVSQDQIVHSYRGVNGRDLTRFLVGKIVTQHDELGQTSDTCVYTELDGSYAPLSRADIPLVYNGTSILAGTDPHGFAQIIDQIEGVSYNKLYIADYDSIKIPLFDAEALRYLPSTSASLGVDSIDIGAWANVLPTLPIPTEDAEYQYRGNGIVALKNGNDWYLFVLLIVPNRYIMTNDDDDDPPPPYLFSRLVRIKLASDLITATEVKALPLGFNAVDMDVLYVNGNPVLLISHIGGMQKGGSNNGTDSKIIKVYDLFSPTFTEGGNTTVLITGDELGDIRSIAIDSNGKVYILVGYFNDENYTGFKWQLYWIDAGDLAGLSETSLSQELEKDPPLLHEFKTGNNDGGYFWALMARGGRLLFVKGSAMVFIDESNLNNTKTFPQGTDPGEIGDVNMNSIDDTEGTQQQSVYDQLAAEGKEIPAHKRRHHNHHHCHHHHHLAQLAAQAAQAAQAAAAQAEQSTGGAEGTGGTGK
jgi:hypothetical protein